MLTEPIKLETFAKVSRADLYNIYRLIKYDVFVTHERWEKLADDSGEAIAGEDQFDELSTFVVAMSEDGCPIGTVRGTALDSGFPHRELFEHYCTQEAFNNSMGSMCSLNALGILPSYRGKQDEVLGQSWKGPIWELLMLSIIDYFQQNGLVGAVATGGGLASARLLRRLGFKFIDRPKMTGLHVDVMINIGLVFGAPFHVRARRQCRMNIDGQAPFKRHTKALWRYFEEREREVLAIQKTHRVP